MPRSRPSSRPSSRPGSRPSSRPSLAGAAALAACLAGAPAAAGNWTLVGATSERLVADSNLRLSEDDGGVVGSITGLELDLGYTTRRTAWALGSGVTFREYVGPGETEDLDGFSTPRLSGSVIRRGRRHVLTADFDALRRPVAFTEIEEAGATESDATETRLGFATGWRLRATPRTSLALAADVDVRRFSDAAPDFTPSTSASVNGALSRTLSPRTQAGLFVNARRFVADGEDEETASTVLSFGGDLATRPSARHTIGLALGVGRTATERTIRLGPVSIRDDEDADLTFNGDLDFAWAATRRTDIVLAASQGLVSTADGTLANTTRLAAGLTRALSRRTSLALSTSFLRRKDEVTPDEEAEDEDELSHLFGITSTLSTELNRFWEASLGAGLRIRNDEDGSAQSASVFVGFSRAFVLNR